MKIFHLLFFILVSVYSCGKLKFTETEINARAISLTDNSPLVGYPVHLVETYVPSRPFSPISVETVATSITDENGAVYFNYELRRNDKYEYTIEFDNNGDNFAPDSWEEGDLGPVVGIITVEKRENNDLILGQVPLGAMKFSVENNSNYGSLLFEIYAIDEFMTSKKFQYEIDQGDVKSNENFQGFLTGQVQLKLVASNQSIKDSIFKELTLGHNDSIEVGFVYPP